MKKKKLLIIANKPFTEDYSSIIADYDMVVRVNRMTNFEMCKGKTDLWLADVHEHALDLFRKEDCEKFLLAKNVISFCHSEATTKEFLAEIGHGKNATFINFDSLPINKYIRQSSYNKWGYRVTNAIWLLIYCLENFPKYKIFTLGFGGRDFLKNPIHNWHNKIADAETMLYEGLALTGRITPIDDEIKPFRKGYSGKIPLFSSFWHNIESDVLPDMVVASINSFVKNGCPYHLYTYKNFRNVPEGCIVKDANEIVPLSDFFIGSRGYYASFADYFRIVLVNKVDTAWTDTDNYFISDDFPTNDVFMVQEGRIQNGFFYINNDERGKRFKEMLLECYNNPAKPLPYDNKEMWRNKRKISIFKGWKNQLSHANWEFGGSALYTNVAQQVDVSDSLYPYEKYFNNFHYTEQSQLFDRKEEDYMQYANSQVRILVMSLALLKREPQIMANFKDNSYMANVLKNYGA